MSSRNKVRKRIKDLRLSHRSIAQYAVLSLSVFELWLEGKVTLPYSAIIKICVLLDLEPDDLVEVV